MTKAVAVSVVMAEYNTDKSYLADAIRSILDQTFVNFEFIIVDDCGKNDVAKIAHTFKDDRIRVIKNVKNIGLANSLNRGIEEARAKYVVRMDTDDFAMSDRIEKLHHYITTHPEYAVVGSRVIEFSELGLSGLLGTCGEKTATSIMRGDMPVHPSTIINTGILRAVGGYDNFNRAEDLALWCKLVLGGSKIYVLDDILLRYRVNTSDYAKRKLKNRGGELKARFHYYPKLGASPFDYLFILNSIMSGAAPEWFVRHYRKTFVLKEPVPENLNPAQGVRSVR